MRAGHVVLQLGLMVVIAAVGAVAAPAAAANRTAVSVEVLSVQAALSPDGRSISFDIETRCDRKATIVQATVSASQPQASGSAAFTPRCNRLPNVVGVTVPTSGAQFRSGDAQVGAVLAVQQGSTKQASDSALVRVRPSVGVRVADQGALIDGGQSLQIGVTVTCPLFGTAQGGQIAIWQTQAAGSARFGPTPCDGFPHTLSVTVPASGGSFVAGSAEAEAFASIEEGGDVFPGSDIRTVQLR
jgi:hypothetical protein